MALSRPTRLSSPPSVLYGVIEALMQPLVSRGFAAQLKITFWAAYTPAALAFCCSEIDFVADGSSPAFSVGKNRAATPSCSSTQSYSCRSSRIDRKTNEQHRRNAPPRRIDRKTDAAATAPRVLRARRQGARHGRSSFRRAQCVDRRRRGRRRRRVGLVQLHATRRRRVHIHRCEDKCPRRDNNTRRQRRAGRQRVDADGNRRGLHDRAHGAPARLYSW